MKIRTLVVVFVAIAVICSAGFAWRHHVIRSPEYSLRRLANAVERHDVATFQELVDVDTVVNRFLDASLAASLADTTDTSLGASIGKGLLALMKPRIADELKASITAVVERGLPAAPSDAGTMGAYTSQWGITRESFKGMSGVSRQGASAMVSLQFYNARIDSTVTVQLRLRDMRTCWQVSEIANAGELVTNINAAESRRLESINRPIRERLAGEFAVENMHKTTKDFDSFFGGEVSLQATIRNVSLDTLAGLNVKLCLKDKKGLDLISIPISSEKPLFPGASYEFAWKKGLGLFSGFENTLVARSRQQDLWSEIKCDRLKLTNGTIIEVFPSLDAALESPGGARNN